MDNNLLKYLQLLADICSNNKFNIGHLKVLHISP